MIQTTKNGDILCRESYLGVFFKSSPLAILEAEYEMNRGFALGEGDCTLAKFYDLLDLEPPPESYFIGWDPEYMAEEWSTYWIEFMSRPAITPDGQPYIDIYYPIPPTNMGYTKGFINP